MKVEVVRAWPRRHLSRVLDLAAGATVADALKASRIDDTGAAGYAVFGERAGLDRRLHEGDRVEVLGPLLADPKEARRKRAGAKPGRR